MFKLIFKGYIELKIKTLMDIKEIPSVNPQPMEVDLNEQPMRSIEELHAKACSEQIKFFYEMIEEYKGVNEIAENNNNTKSTLKIFCMLIMYAYLLSGTPPNARPIQIESLDDTANFDSGKSVSNSPVENNEESDSNSQPESEPEPSYVKFFVELNSKKEDQENSEEDNYFENFMEMIFSQKRSQSAAKIFATYLVRAYRAYNISLITKTRHYVDIVNIYKELYRQPKSLDNFVKCCMFKYVGDKESFETIYSIIAEKIEHVDINGEEYTGNFTREFHDVLNSEYSKRNDADKIKIIEKGKSNIIEVMKMLFFENGQLYDNFIIAIESFLVKSRNTIVCLFERTDNNLLKSYEEFFDNYIANEVIQKKLGDEEYEKKQISHNYEQKNTICGDNGAAAMASSIANGDSSGINCSFGERAKHFFVAVNTFLRNLNDLLDEKKSVVAFIKKSDIANNETLNTLLKISNAGKLNIGVGNKITKLFKTMFDNTEISNYVSLAASIKEKLESSDKLPKKNEIYKEPLFLYHFTELAASYISESLEGFYPNLGQENVRSTFVEKVWGEYYYPYLSSMCNLNKTSDPLLSNYMHYTQYYKAEHVQYKEAQDHIRNLFKYNKDEIAEKHVIINSLKTKYMTLFGNEKIENVYFIKEFSKFYNKFLVTKDYGKIFTADETEYFLNQRAAKKSADKKKENKRRKLTKAEAKKNGATKNIKKADVRIESDNADTIGHHSDSEIEENRSDFD